MMTPEQIAEIRAWLENRPVSAGAEWAVKSAAALLADRDELVAAHNERVDRLIEEIEALRKDANEMDARIARLRVVAVAAKETCEEIDWPNFTSDGERAMFVALAALQPGDLP